jgi:tetratricopeptide (TPR) repeat protein
MTISQLDSALSRYEAAITALEKPKFDVTLDILIFRSSLQPRSPILGLTQKRSPNKVKKEAIDISPFLRGARGEQAFRVSVRKSCILWFFVVLYRTQVERVGILSALIARNAVQSALSDISEIPQEKLIRVIELDSRLREQTEFVIRKVELAEWCASFNPPKEAWWWFPESSSHPLDRFDWLWNVLTLASLTASFSLVGDIVPRFWSGSPGLLGSLGVVFPSVLTLLTAGGVLTQTGRKLIEPVLLKFGIKKYYWEEIKLGLSFILLVSLIGFKSSLPQLAEGFNKWGDGKFNTGDWSSAMSDYQRAISLDPDNAKAHYNLGSLYEVLQDLDKAKTEYKLATQGDLADAYIDLSRLYIKETKYSEAASLLYKAEEEWSKLERNDQYELRKNLGWARLMQKLYAEAENQLGMAIEIDAKPASAHCLLAQALEGRGNSKNAVSEWKICFKFANPRVPEEDAWYGMARKRLLPKGKQ